MSRMRAGFGTIDEHRVGSRRTRFASRAGALVCVLALCGIAAGEFPSVTTTSFRERLSGKILRLADAPTPETGDQIGVFAGDTIVGSTTLSSQDIADGVYRVTVNGDVPTTSADEGPSQGDPLTVRFFDKSTNTTITAARFENTAGEAVSVTFQGQQVIDFPIPGLDLTPTREFNVRLTGTTSGGNGGGNGGGDGGGDSGVDGDVNNDGVVNSDDAAMVLSIVIGGSVDADTLDKADVDGDETVSVKDAVAILRIR